MAPSFDWWPKEKNRGTPVVVKMENPNNWSMVEPEGATEEDFLVDDLSPMHHGNSLDKGRNKNAKQLTWVLLLKAHKAAGCLTNSASALLTLGSIIRRRVAAGRTDTTDTLSSENINSLDRLILCLGCFWIRLRKIKPIAKGDLLDLESGDDGAYSPMVLVQVPMCNEKEDSEDVGLVQARWSFVNKEENLLTRLQHINLAFHFEVEQQVNGIFLNFLGLMGLLVFEE